MATVSFHLEEPKANRPTATFALLTIDRRTRYLRTGTGIFAHRSAFPFYRLYYDGQLEAKRFRGLAKYYSVDRVWEAEYRKGRKKHYQGRPTKWYAKRLRLEQEAAAPAPAMFQRVLKGLG